MAARGWRREKRAARRRRERRGAIGFRGRSEVKGKVPARIDGEVSIDGGGGGWWSGFTLTAVDLERE